MHLFHNKCLKLSHLSRNIECIVTEDYMFDTLNEIDVNINKRTSNLGENKIKI